jgi:hypothetical protein
MLRICIKTEGLTRIHTDETIKNGQKAKSNSEIQGSFTSFRMTDVKNSSKTPSMAVCVQVLREYPVCAEFMLMAWLSRDLGFGE